MKYCILLLGLCLVACNSQESKQDTIATNHYKYPLMKDEERRVLQCVDSVLEVEGVKLIDYPNEIYQYKDMRFYWNRKFNYFLVYPDFLIQGEEAYLCDGNHFYTEDSTIVLNVFAAYYDMFEEDLAFTDYFRKFFINENESISYKQVNDIECFIKGKDEYENGFMRKGVSKEIYDRKIVIILNLAYKRNRKIEAESIWEVSIKHFPNKPF